MNMTSRHRITARPFVAGSCLLLSAVAFGSAALAQGAEYDPQVGAPTRYQASHTGILNGKFWTDTRYRYEYVDQANLPKDARASTIRNKTGVEFRILSWLPRRRRRRVRRRAGAGPFQQHDQRQDPVPGRRRCRVRRSIRPISSCITFRAWCCSAAAISSNPDNLRYVGSVAWRQNDQTFDGAKATITAFPSVTFLYAYIGNVNRIFSDSSPVGNIHSNVHLMHAESKELSIGKLTAYTYLMDLYDLDRFSNASYGGFLKGKQKLTPTVSTTTTVSNTPSRPATPTPRSTMTRTMCASNRA